MIENLTERQRQLLAEHEERQRTAEPGKPISRTFMKRMMSSFTDPSAPSEQPVAVEEQPPTIFRP